MNSAGVQGSGFRVQGSGFRVQGSGFRVQGSGFRVQGSRWSPPQFHWFFGEAPGLRRGRWSPPHLHQTAGGGAHRSSAGSGAPGAPGHWPRAAAGPFGVAPGLRRGRWSPPQLHQTAGEPTAAPSVTYLRSPTSNLFSSELPRSSGAYIPQSLAGRALNVPGTSARRRYETLCLPRASCRMKKAVRSSRNST